MPQDTSYDGSKFWFYSFGQVVEDNPQASNLLKVNLTEVQPLQSGPIGQFSRQHNVSVPDAKGVKRNSKVVADDYVVAKWLGGDDINRHTAPCLYKGATVRVYRYADTDEYFWTTHALEPSLQRLERVRWGASDLEGGKEAFDGESSYYLEFSTLKGEKGIRLRTARSNGERYRYFLEFDPERNFATLSDDAGQSATLYSEEGKVDVLAREEVTATTKKVTVVATDSIVFQTKLFKVDAETIEFNAGNFVVNAIATFKKFVKYLKGAKMEGGGSSGGSGSFDLDCPINSTQGATFNGTVEAQDFIDR